MTEGNTTESDLPEACNDVKSRIDREMHDEMGGRPTHLQMTVEMSRLGDGARAYDALNGIKEWVEKHRENIQAKLCAFARLIAGRASFRSLPWRLGRKTDQPRRNGRLYGGNPRLPSEQSGRNFSCLISIQNPYGGSGRSGEHSHRGVPDSGGDAVRDGLKREGGQRRGSSAGEGYSPLPGRATARREGPSAGRGEA